MSDEISRTGKNVQLVSFNVGEEEYGVHIEEVQSVIRLPEITHLPNTAEFIKGVINLRGDVIPVIDMRERFGMESVEHSAVTRVIIVQLEDRFTGLIVDTVSQVLTLESSDISEPPEIINGISREYIEGIGKVNDSMIIILKIGRVLSAEEIGQLAEVKLNTQDEKEVMTA